MEGGFSHIQSQMCSRTEVKFYKNHKLQGFCLTYCPTITIDLPLKLTGSMASILSQVKSFIRMNLSMFHAVMFASSIGLLSYTVGSVPECQSSMRTCS